MNSLLRKIYSRRDPWSRKGDFGYVLVVGGSNAYSGSPAFNAVAALRSGADLVHIAGPKRAMDIAAGFLPDLITHPFAGEFSSAHIPAMLRLARRTDALVIGGGLARMPKTSAAIRAFLRTIHIPMVIDAEAIRAVAKDPRIPKGKQAVLTPHAEEFRVLTGERVRPELHDRKEKVLRASRKIGAVILLKGHADVISDGKRVAVNTTGSSSMTKGGFGDVLAGICGALMARGIAPFDAAVAAAYINGKAGEAAAREYGEGILASDIFKYIPLVISANHKRKTLNAQHSVRRWHSSFAV